MKAYAIAVFLVSAACTSSLDTATGDASAVGVKVYACKPSDADCSRIISKNRLAGLSCDSVKAKYPRFILTG